MNNFIYPSPNLSPLIKEEWKGSKSRKFYTCRKIIIPKSHDIFFIDKNATQNQELFQRKKYINVGMNKERKWRSSSKFILPFESILNNQKNEKFLSQKFNYNYRYNDDNDDNIRLNKSNLLKKNKKNIENENKIDLYLNKSINNLLCQEYNFIQKNKHLKKQYDNLKNFDILSSNIHYSMYKNLNQSKSMKEIFKRCCNEIIKQDYNKNKNYIKYNKLNNSVLNIN